MAATKTAKWDESPEDTLYSVRDLSTTPLAALAIRTRYALIARGAIASVIVGSRRYVSKRAIIDFIRGREGPATAEVQRNRADP